MRKFGIKVFMAVFAVLLIISVIWFFSGSLEQFPTAEQEGKIRIAAVIMMLICIVTESVLFILLKRSKSES